MTGDRKEGPEIGWMIRGAGPLWTGPTPQASRARWAVLEPRAGFRRSLGWAAGAVALTAVAFASVTVGAAAVSPGTAAPVTNVMSHVFSRNAEPSAVPQVATPAAPTPKPDEREAVITAPPSARPHTPRWGSGDDDRSLSTPAPSGRQTPQPSAPPDS